MQNLIMTQPDDWHCHLRDDTALATTVVTTAQQFARAIIMPNLKPPVTDADLARAYYQRILKHIPLDSNFTPLMALYLTDHTTPAVIDAAKKSGIVYAAKLYPAGATTHSTDGVTDLNKISDVLQALQDIGLPLLIHGEVTDFDIDIFAREQVFIDRELTPLLTKFDRLKIVLEHISTSYAVDFVKAGPSNLAATITPQHLWLTRNDLLVGGIKPDFYCLPIVKMAEDRDALIAAATSGNAKFFLGTDSAPHSQDNKHTACGCAGMFTAYNALELYAEIFANANALDNLESFASFNGADFYGLPRNTAKIELIRKDWRPPEYLPLGEGKVKLFMGGEVLKWKGVRP